MAPTSQDTPLCDGGPGDREVERVWVCLDCGEQHLTDDAPDRCHACGRENLWPLRHR